MSTYKELLAQREQLEQQLSKAFKEEKLNVIGEIMRKMSAHQITIDEIRGERARPTKEKAAAKYRDPASGKEWSGRGKPPNWIKDVQDRSRYLISA